MVRWLVTTSEKQPMIFKFWSIVNINWIQLWKLTISQCFLYKFFSFSLLLGDSLIILMNCKFCWGDWWQPVKNSEWYSNSDILRNIDWIQLYKATISQCFLNNFCSFSLLLGDSLIMLIIFCKFCWGVWSQPLKKQWIIFMLRLIGEHLFDSFVKSNHFSMLFKQFLLILNNIIDVEIEKNSNFFTDNLSFAYIVFIFGLHRPCIIFLQIQNTYHVRYWNNPIWQLPVSIHMTLTCSLFNNLCSLQK